jgi:hypothetical protein
MFVMDLGKGALLLIALFCLLPQDVYAANHGDDGDSSTIDWSRTYGGAGTDVGLFIQRTEDGGYVIAGYTDSFGAGNSDVYLLKTDSEGSLIWNKTYGGAYSDFGYSVQETSDGGYVIAGYTRSFGNKDDDVYLVRVDSEGNEIWNRTYGVQGATINNERGYSVQQTNDGGFIIAGETNSSERGENDLHDVYIVKTDPEGSLIWNKTYGGDRSDEGRSVQETSDGGYIIAGETTSFGERATEVYLIKIDSEGNEIWSQTFGDMKGDERGYSVQGTIDGGYIVAGMSWPLEQENPDFYLLKTDSEGNEFWSTSYTGPDGHWSWDWGRSVMETGDGGYIIIGETYSEADRNQDVLLVKTDSLGNLLWSRTYGGNGSEGGNSVLEAGDGGYVIAGKTKSFGAGEYDVYVVKTKPLPVPVSISCQASVDKMKMGQKIVVSGVISPATLGRNITLTYTPPEGSETVRYIGADEEGAFRDGYTPNLPGLWTVTASTESDIYHEASSSEPASFTAEEPLDVVTLYAYGLLAAIFVIAILAAWKLRKRS